MPIDPYYQRLAKLRPEVLIAWIQMRGFSFFPEELVAVAHMVDADRRAQLAAEIDRLLQERKSRPSPAVPAALEHAGDVAELVKVR